MLAKGSITYLLTAPSYRPIHMTACMCTVISMVPKAPESVLDETHQQHLDTCEITLASMCAQKHHLAQKKFLSLKFGSPEEPDHLTRLELLAKCSWMCN